MFRSILKKKEISDDEFKLVKIFISSNTAIAQLENETLRDLLHFKIPCVQTFTNTLLPSIFEKVRNAINMKCQEAENICLISDIWTNQRMHDFIGLVFSLINANFEREFVVMGMMIMPGNHCAEHIQEATQDLVNEYDFDFSKITGKLNHGIYNSSFRFKLF